MNYSDSTDAHIAAAPWADPFEAMMGFSDTTFLPGGLDGIRAWVSLLCRLGTSQFQRRQ